MARGVTVTIPEEIDLAIRAEAYRVGCRPGEVLTRWLRETFPEYVLKRLAEDLCHPGSREVLDVEVIDHSHPDAATPPALTDGATPNPMVRQPQVTHTLTAGDLDDEDTRGGSID